ncbi:MAG: enoyl-CoA hydratase/isomerase family protein [Mobilicoccus sp.]|nr:enoyl-CoA hydratase/isomerase family protein [Mobilicoccus sp.]
MNDVTRPHPRLAVRREGAVLHVRLDAPEKRNAQVPSLWLALAEIATTLPEDVRVVVLSGEGASFSAGLDRRMLTPGGVEGEADLTALAVRDEQALADEVEGFQRAFTAWQDSHAFVIAAVQGYAIGAGFQLALAADLRIVATDVAFVMAEVSLGLVPDLGGTMALTRLIGASRALELCLTGRPVGADEAVATGIASLAVDPDQLDATAADLAAAVCEADPDAAREIVALFRGITGRTQAEQLRLEREAQARRIAALGRAAR